MLKQTIANAKVSGVTSQRSRSRVMITDITILESDSKSIVIFNKDRKMLRRKLHLMTGWSVNICSNPSDSLKRIISALILNTN